ncbi:MAG: hypothetical protein B7Y40_01795 [Gammaproteobacteria bacterium 28-57-27]|nr:MAG: hypothetical protein B7Y40_01795 [Gammaproteobacteria bacterium 28-57-27]
MHESELAKVVAESFGITWQRQCAGTDHIEGTGEVMASGIRGLFLILMLFTFFIELCFITYLYKEFKCGR